jgi:hypothetical protein
MDHFDFERVHKMMEAVQWRWATADGGGVPRVPDLKKSARERLKGALRAYIESGADEPYSCGSGGFTATARVVDDKYALKLVWGVCWDNYDEAFGEDV